MSSAVAASEPETAPAPAADDFIPTRRVREAPGGKQLLQLFEDEFPNDALAAAPNQSAGEAPTGVVSLDLTCKGAGIEQLKCSRRNQVHRTNGVRFGQVIFLVSNRLGS